jgi:hypothetical protein
MRVGPPKKVASQPVNDEYDDWYGTRVPKPDVMERLAMPSEYDSAVEVRDAVASLEREMNANIGALLSVFREIAEQLDRIADRLVNANVLDSSD